MLFGIASGSKNAIAPGKLPIIIAGGSYQHGQYVPHDRPNNPPLCNLFVRTLNDANLDTESFGQCTGELTWVGLQSAPGLSVAASAVRSGIRSA